MRVVVRQSFMLWTRGVGNIVAAVSRISQKRARFAIVVENKHSSNGNSGLIARTFSAGLELP